MYIHIYAGYIYICYIYIYMLYIYIHRYTYIYIYIHIYAFIDVYGLTRFFPSRARFKQKHTVVGAMPGQGRAGAGRSSEGQGLSDVRDLRSSINGGIYEGFS